MTVRARGRRHVAVLAEDSLRRPSTGLFFHSRNVDSRCMPFTGWFTLWQPPQNSAFSWIPEYSAGWGACGSLSCARRVPLGSTRWRCCRLDVLHCDDLVAEHAADALLGTRTRDVAGSELAGHRRRWCVTRPAERSELAAGGGFGLRDLRIEHRVAQRLRVHRHGPLAHEHRVACARLGRRERVLRGVPGFDRQACCAGHGWREYGRGSNHRQECHKSFSFHR